MNRNAIIAFCLAAGLTAGGCSTKPRQFSAQVRPVTTTAKAETEVFTTCNEMVRSGRTKGFAVAAATSGAATAGAMGGAGLAVSGLTGGGLATAGATALAAMPIIGFAAAFGMNRMIRSGRERKYRTHMTSCMGEMGYEVVDWNRAAKKQPGSASLVPAAERGELATAAPSTEPSPDAVQIASVPPAPGG